MNEDRTEVEAELETKLGKLKGRMSGKDFNTIVSIGTVVLLTLLLGLEWRHVEASARRDESLRHAMQDVAQAVREGNCINSYRESIRESKVEQCKRITR